MSGCYPRFLAVCIAFWFWSHSFFFFPVVLGSWLGFCSFRWHLRLLLCCRLPLVLGLDQSIRPWWDRITLFPVSPVDIYRHRSLSQLLLRICINLFCIDILASWFTVILPPVTFNIIGLLHFRWILIFFSTCWYRLRHVSTISLEPFDDGSYHGYLYV
ncbi:hypothetical protein BJ508DRAFT_30387 [Ascobolus immersus RN42]|uniref:Uncharacterized protein n=1 Tax=Ascobolus immersus RN42 TaxID=1160509 RepID=A0A3N4HLR0_ASCIM|nr:hypothetical protein BJ508DRAFT_30387 [Ascobolus immersus RN42]